MLLTRSNVKMTRLIRIYSLRTCSSHASLYVQLYQNQVEEKF